MRLLLIAGVTLLVLPWLLAVAGGLHALYGAGLLPIWLAGAFTATLLGLWALRRTGIRWFANARRSSAVLPDPTWPPAALPAWQQVQRLASELDPQQYPFDDADRILALGQRTVECVARHFHPDSRQPVFEITGPDLLQIAELVSRDLRRLVSDYIPFSHRLTVRAFLRLAGGLDAAQKGRQIYRKSTGGTPLQRLAGELAGVAGEAVLGIPVNQLRGWLLESYVKRVGYYAIALYGKHLALRPEQVGATTASSARQSAKAARETTAEPLRIVVLGQINAGKSSLINALYGELRAATDPLPLTADFTPYRLAQKGLGEEALILDSAGYGDRDEALWLQANQETLLASDLVLLVLAANQAARAPDRRVLDQLRALFQAHPERAMPPLLVVLTHIDQLRPVREWQPPYDLNDDTNPKARTIRAVMEAVGTELMVELSDVVPVSLQPEGNYNVDDGLHAAVLAHLDQARRARYLRCLRETQRRERWEAVYRQLANAGRLIAKAAVWK